MSPLKNAIKRLFPWLVPLLIRYRNIKRYQEYIKNAGRYIYIAHSSPVYSDLFIKEGSIGTSPQLARALLGNYSEAKKSSFLAHPATIELSVLLRRHRFSGNVLDVGCLNGEWTRNLFEVTGLNCVGLDVDSNIVEVLNEYNNQTDHIRYVTGTVESLPFEDLSFGLVVVSGVLAYVQDFPAVLEEIYRVSSEYVLIGRMATFKHHSEALVYQDGRYKVWVRNRNEVLSSFSNLFDVVDQDYSVEVAFVDNIAEPIICTHYLLRKKHRA